MSSSVMAALPRRRYDGVDIWSRHGAARPARLGFCIQLNIEGVERAQDEAQLGATMASFDRDDPLTAHADLRGKIGLADAELLAAVADNRAKIGRCTNKHKAPCRRSTT